MMMKVIPMTKIINKWQELIIKYTDITKINNKQAVVLGIILIIMLIGLCYVLSLDPFLPGTI